VDQVGLMADAYIKLAAAPAPADSSTMPFPSIIKRSTSRRLDKADPLKELPAYDMNESRKMANFRCSDRKTEEDPCS
jgi:hypothetical protein